MKNVFAVIAILGLTLSSFADIPLPHNGSHQTESSSRTFSGVQAKQTWTSIRSSEIRGSSNGWAGYSETYKVLRSEDGLNQTVCSKQTFFRGNQAPLFSCTVEKSVNGRPLPVFVPVIRMG